MNMYGYVDTIMKESEDQNERYSTYKYSRIFGSTEKERTLSMAAIEKIDSILGGFLKKNSGHLITAYINNSCTHEKIGQVTVTTERKFTVDNKKSMLEWECGHCGCNNLVFLHGEVMDCYEEIYERGLQSVYVILKNGIEVEFDCWLEK